jgi:hypothetical protein
MIEENLCALAPWRENSISAVHADPRLRRVTACHPRLRRVTACHPRALHDQSLGEHERAEQPDAELADEQVSPARLLSIPVMPIPGVPRYFSASSASRTATFLERRLPKNVAAPFG